MHLALKSAMSRIPYTNKVGETLSSIADSAAAYSLRALGGGDPMVARVRRSSDDAEKDFTASDMGAALEYWVGSGIDGHVTTAYDQSGNGNDATESTTSSQPKIVDSGVLVLDVTEDQSFPYTVGFQSGTSQIRDLSSITTSDNYSFNQNLTSLYVGSNVTSIGSYAFFGCSSLTSITIPDSVTSIGSDAFGDCSSLTSITIPDSVTSIGSSAFFNCLSLATINCIATTAPTLGSNAFNNVSATDIHVPAGATGYGTTYGGLTVVADL
jgi:hypothetical protein